MTVTVEDILKKFPDLVNFQSGNKNMRIQFPCPPWNIKKGALVFIHKKKYLETLPKEEIVLVQSQSLGFKDTSHLYCVLTASNLKLAMAKICAYFFPPRKELILTKTKGESINNEEEKTNLNPLTHPTALIHPTAFVEKSSKISKSVSIGAFTSIEEGVEIGEGSSIGSHSVLRKGVKIGKNALIHPHVYIDSFCEIGDQCEIQSQTSIGSEGFGYATDENGKHFRIPHYGRVILEEAVFIGSNVSIDRGTFEDTLIGAGTKIDNHIHIAHNVQIGKHCVITAGFIVAGSAKIGDRCHIGGRTTIKGHLQITDDVYLASYSIVTNSISKKGVYGGIPILMPLREALKYIGVLPYLPEMRKNIKRLMEKVGLTDKQKINSIKEMKEHQKTTNLESSPK